MQTFGSRPVTDTEAVNEPSMLNTTACVRWLPPPLPLFAIAEVADGRTATYKSAYVWSPLTTTLTGLRPTGRDRSGGRVQTNRPVLSVTRSPQSNSQSPPPAPAPAEHPSPTTTPPLHPPPPPIPSPRRQYTSTFSPVSDTISKGPYVNLSNGMKSDNVKLLTSLQCCFQLNSPCDDDLRHRFVDDDVVGPVIGANVFYLDWSAFTLPLFTRRRRTERQLHLLLLLVVFMIQEWSGTTDAGTRRSGTGRRSCCANEASVESDNVAQNEGSHIGRLPEGGVQQMRQCRGKEGHQTFGAIEDVIESFGSPPALSQQCFRSSSCHCTNWIGTPINKVLCLNWNGPRVEGERLTLIAGVVVVVLRLSSLLLLQSSWRRRCWRATASLSVVKQLRIGVDKVDEIWRLAVAKWVALVARDGDGPRVGETGRKEGFEASGQRVHQVEHVVDAVEATRPTPLLTVRFTSGSSNDIQSAPPESVVTIKKRKKRRQIRVMWWWWICSNNHLLAVGEDEGEGTAEHKAVAHFKVESGPLATVISIGAHQRWRQRRGTRRCHHIYSRSSTPSLSRWWARWTVNATVTATCGEL